MSFQSFTARWILPVAGPPVENGILVVRDDKIEAIEPKGTRKADIDLGNVALIPGLVNAHTHLDLSGARGLIPPTDPEHFTDWLKGVIAYRRTRTPEQVQQDIRVGLAECMGAGTTSIGDIASGGASWEAIAHSDIRGISFFEQLGLSAEKMHAAITDYIKWMLMVSNVSDHFRFGRSPHAPYSANCGLFMVNPHLGPVTIHLAESAFEADFLEQQKGPFVELLHELSIGPVEKQWLCRWHSIVLASSTNIWVNQIWSEQGTLPHVLFIHANYLPLDCQFSSNQSIVYCPRTHAAFGHPPHPFREFMKRGVRVCLGTDSLASNPDLDILAEARFVKQRYPDFDGETLLKMVTLFGAEALGWADECGSLEAGKSAEAVAVPLADRDGDPYDLLFVDPAPGERKTMFRGEWRN